MSQSTMFFFLLFSPLLYQLVAADCGCGVRCVKYSTADQCTRCCTATVRRSVPIDEIYDRPLSAPVQFPVFKTFKRGSTEAKSVESDFKRFRNFKSAETENEILPQPVAFDTAAEIEQLTEVIGNLYVEEFRATSKSRKAILRRTRSRLQRYRKSKMRGLAESSSQEDLYDLLDSILKEIWSRDRNSTTRRKWA
uniref:Uncharacterized protein n=1 Tax=Panagrellus redivivus TaxID=6233 RepID=A0A7E4VRJ6_PANRE